LGSPVIALRKYGISIGFSADDGIIARRAKPDAAIQKLDCFGFASQ
jgi:hypothetical protein